MSQHPDSIQPGHVYGSLSFVEDYLRDGTFPKIHHDMAVAMDFIPRAERAGAFDMGACHGLLALQAKALGYRSVIGTEPHMPSVQLFNEQLKPLPGALGVRIEHIKFDPLKKEHADWLVTTAFQNRITTILARRFFPECLCDTYGKAGRDPDHIRVAGAAFSQVAHDAGVRHIVLEGRVVSHRVTHPLGRIGAEIEALGPTWEVMARFKNCAVLRPRG